MKHGTISVTNAATDPALEINQDGAAIALKVDQDGNATALDVNQSTGYVGLSVNQNTANLLSTGHALSVGCSTYNTAADSAVVKFVSSHANTTQPNLHVLCQNPSTAIYVENDADATMVASQLINQTTAATTNSITWPGVQFKDDTAALRDYGGLLWRSRGITSAANAQWTELDFYMDATGSNTVNMMTVSGEANNTGDKATLTVRNTSSGGPQGTVIKVTDTGTGHGLFIDHGGSGTKATSHSCLFVDSVRPMTNSATPIVRFRSDNASTTQQVLRIDQANASSSAPGLGIIQLGTGPEIEAYGNSAMLPYPWIKMGSFQYDLSTATGTQQITGVGFKPRMLMFFGGPQSGTDSFAAWGMSDGSIDGCLADWHSATADTYDVSTVEVMRIVVSGSGNRQAAVVNTYDVDGFTLGWTKVGSPTGTLTVMYLAIG